MMNNFFSNLWYGFLILMVHGLRGMIIGCVFFAVCLYGLTHTPDSLVLVPNSPSMDLLPFKRTLLLGFGIMALILLFTTWIKDWKYNYWKIRW